MEPLTIKALYEKRSSRRRNPIIADIFYRSGQIEAWGRGTLKMIQNAKKEGFPPPTFDTFENGLLVHFRKSDPTKDPTSDPINDRILHLLKTQEGLCIFRSISPKKKSKPL